MAAAPQDQITSSDQRRRASSPRLARAGALAAIVLLLVMLAGNHEGNIENLFLVLTAVGLSTMLVVDHLLRKNGLRR